MEYLDAYQENKEYIGKFPRDYVHEQGLWHNTVHCWLYDDLGNIYFQIRSDAGKFYTTASGHVRAGETIKEAFGREVKEEIGIDVNYEEAFLLEVVPWKMDKEKNGKLIKDRAFANVYLLNIKNHQYHFVYDDGECMGVAKMQAREVLDLLDDKVASIKGTVIYEDNKPIEKDITKDDFLVMPHETLKEKYGKILEAVKNRS